MKLQYATTNYTTIPTFILFGYGARITGMVSRQVADPTDKQIEFCFVSGGPLIIPTTSIRKYITAKPALLLVNPNLINFVPPVTVVLDRYNDPETHQETVRLWSASRKTSCWVTQELIMDAKCMFGGTDLDMLEAYTAELDAWEADPELHQKLFNEYLTELKAIQESKQ